MAQIIKRTFVLDKSERSEALWRLKPNEHSFFFGDHMNQTTTTHHPHHPVSGAPGRDGPRRHRPAGPDRHRLRLARQRDRAPGPPGRGRRTRRGRRRLRERDGSRSARTRSTSSAMDSRADAVAAIEERDVSAAFVFTPDGAELLTASAGSPAVAQMMQQIAVQLAAAHPEQPPVTDHRRRPAPRGRPPRPGLQRRLPADRPRRHPGRRGRGAAGARRPGLDPRDPRHRGRRRPGHRRRAPGLARRPGRQLLGERRRRRRSGSPRSASPWSACAARSAWPACPSAP